MPQNNTEVLPVEEQKIKGQIKHILVELPALVIFQCKRSVFPRNYVTFGRFNEWTFCVQDAQWAVPRRFSFYVFPPKKLPDGNYVPGSKETWLECMSHLLDDIWWLCELPYHKCVNFNLGVYSLCGLNCRPLSFHLEQGWARSWEVISSLWVWDHLNDIKSFMMFNHDIYGFWITLDCVLGSSRKSEQEHEFNNLKRS